MASSGFEGGLTVWKSGLRNTLFVFIIENVVDFALPASGFNGYIGVIVGAVLDENRIGSQEFGVVSEEVGCHTIGGLEFRTWSGVIIPDSYESRITFATSTSSSPCP